VGLGVEDRGIAVGIGERLGDGPLGQAAHLGEHLPGGVGIEVAVRALAERLVHSEDLEEVEYLVTDVALVVAHAVSSMRNLSAVGYSGLSYPPVTAADYTAR
jgi:hypothetical protein